MRKVHPIVLEYIQHETIIEYFINLGEGTEDQQNRGETHSQASQPNQKKESKLKKTEYRIN